MTFDIHDWWAALSAVALLNGVLWWLAARALRNQAPADGYQRTQLYLSAVYVVVCAFRSFLPRADVQRICLWDSPLSSVFVGRSVATVAELCFAVQWALLIRELGRAYNQDILGKLARVLVPMIVGAEIASWYAVLSTNFLGNVLEQSTWTTAGVLISLSLLRVYPAAPAALQARLRWLAPILLAFVWFMCTVDIPHYFTRWVHDEQANKVYMHLLDGLRDSATRWIVTYDWDAWRDEVAWMSLYFSVGVWTSISFSRMPIRTHETASMPVDAWATK
jgi:hypothetical protein